MVKRLLGSLVVSLLLTIGVLCAIQSARFALNHTHCSSTAPYVSALEKFPVAGLHVRTVRVANLSFSCLECGSGSSAGKLVVFLHGFPDNARTFRHQMKAACAAGYHAIAPTLRGYEPSSIPANKDERTFWISEAADDILKIAHAVQNTSSPLPFHLVGHDWGSLIAYHIVARSPERLRSLTTLAVPNWMPLSVVLRPSQLFFSWYVFYFQLPLLPEASLTGTSTHCVLRKLWRDWSPNLAFAAQRAAPNDESSPAHARESTAGNGDAESRDDASDALARPTADFESDMLQHFASVRHTLSSWRVAKAAVTYYRTNFVRAALTPSFWLTEAGRVSRNVLLFGPKIAVPTFSLTGARDGCVQTEFFSVMEDDSNYVSGVAHEFKRYPDAGHFLHMEMPDVVSHDILAWIGKNDK